MECNTFLAPGSPLRQLCDEHGCLHALLDDMLVWFAAVSWILELHEEAMRVEREHAERTLKEESATTVHTPPVSRLPGRTLTWQEHYVRHGHAASALSTANSVRDGHSVVFIPDFLPHEDRSSLVTSGILARKTTDPACIDSEAGSASILRLSVANQLDHKARALSATIQKRLLSFVESELPSLAMALFGRAVRLSDMHAKWYQPYNVDVRADSARLIIEPSQYKALIDRVRRGCMDLQHAVGPEPNVNIYEVLSITHTIEPNPLPQDARAYGSTPRMAEHRLHSAPLITLPERLRLRQVGGSFEPHTDNHHLTVLVPLSGDDDFVGGGTAFYDDSMGTYNDTPLLVARPPSGTAILWGGRARHAALPVANGTRIVYIGSFSLYESLDSMNAEKNDGSSFIGSPEPHHAIEWTSDIYVLSHPHRLSARGLQLRQLSEAGLLHKMAFVSFGEHELSDGWMNGQDIVAMPNWPLDGRNSSFVSTLVSLVEQTCGVNEAEELAELARLRWARPVPRGDVLRMLSHARAWGRICEQGSVGPALVLEDDAKLESRFVERLPMYLQSLPPNWDLLHLTHSPRVPGWYRSRLATGLVGQAEYEGVTLGYMLSTQGACKLTAAFNPQRVISPDEFLPALSAPHLRPDVRALFTPRISAFSCRPSGSSARSSRRISCGLISQSEKPEVGADVEPTRTQGSRPHVRSGWQRSYRSE